MNNGLRGGKSESLELNAVGHARGELTGDKSLGTSSETERRCTRSSTFSLGWL